VGWVTKDATSCRLLVDSVFDFNGWDHDETHAYVALAKALYKIPY
jgi:hypothetical protein